MPRKAVPAPTQSRRLVNKQQAAAYVGQSDKTIERRIADGTIAGYHFGKGRTVLVDLDEIDAVLRRIPAVRREAS